MQIPVPPEFTFFDRIELLRRAIADLFVVTDTTLDSPNPGYVRFRGQFLRAPSECYDELRRRFEQHNYTPMIRQEDDQIILIAVPTVFKPTRSGWLMNLLLFIATIFSTLYVGALYETNVTEFSWSWSNLWLGWPFSLSLMLILGAHELGHYFAARYHKVPVTLPYFIPLPTQYSLIGTMGAFIRLKSPVKNRRALLDVGAAGPLAGLVFAIPILFYGLYTSDVTQLPLFPYLREGNSLLYMAAKYIVFGQVLPANGLDVTLNQVAWAGWVGLLVTGLNLLPVGQLDGGHVSYVLFGKKAKLFFWPVLAGLAAIVFLSGTFTWVLWIFLLFFVGRHHAEPLDDVTLLDPKRKAIAIFTLLLFFLVFIPIPFEVIQP